ncbi:phosphoribosyltransferase [Flavobacteriaceae bacterium TP-CH-4]|uniref:Phosphoribosyltransferase n=1 Tax=Pelagihabitans pacificus TaxID=2696054 RepID=A0A967AVC0_9FLAO|nr:phosphoribosyltransferase family protein [Pelagihabitans pacificus]NHF59728.1 phosphoribosyltransferase [Pelagihabitans pacificus]
MFKDRIDAGLQLAEKLVKYKDENLVVLAIPRGGLPLGAIVAKSLHSPLDVALTKKIGHPYHKEYAIGAVSLENRILTNAMGVTQGYIEEETARIRKKLEKRHRQYYQNRSPVPLEDKIVIIVDDGIATGNTILATVELVYKQQPRKIVVAIPVAPPSAIRKLKDTPNVDEVICIETPRHFQAVGQFYEEFYQVSDEEAISLLEETHTSKKA